MTPEKEAVLALKLSREALRLHQRSRIAGWPRRRPKACVEVEKESSLAVPRHRGPVCR